MTHSPRTREVCHCTADEWESGEAGWPSDPSGGGQAIAAHSRLLGEPFFYAPMLRALADKRPTGFTGSSKVKGEACTLVDW